MILIIRTESHPISELAVNSHKKYFGKLNLSYIDNFVFYFLYELY